MDSTLALQALAAVMADAPMRARFLGLTGYDPATLRARAGTPDMAVAIAEFLSGHEPDLLKIAGELGVSPKALMA
jgi:Na+-translocating ferredoxin:NAD+ oxidoreductase RnfC subunit